MWSSNEFFNSSSQNKVIYQGVLTTVRLRLDLWYKIFRRPWTTVSLTIFLYFISKTLKRLSKKLTLVKENHEYEKKYIVKLSYSAQKQSYKFLGWKSQFYIQLLYRPHFGPWLLPFGLLGSKREISETTEFLLK